MKILLKAAQIVCLDAQDTILEPGYLLVADGRFQTINYHQAHQELETNYAELAKKRG